MGNFAKRIERVASVVAVLACAAPAWSQSFTLSPASQITLPIVPATAGDVLIPRVPPAPGVLPPPVVGLPGLKWALLPGDVIDAIAFFGPTSIAGATIYFSVRNGSVGIASPTTPTVNSEDVTAVPIGFAPQGGADIFSTADPLCTPFGFHSQVLDGDGVPLSAPLTCYPGFGLGLVESVGLGSSSPGDDINAFAWKLPGWSYGACNVFSLGPGSPTLRPGTNPALPSGAEPGDLLQWCIGGPGRIERPANLRAAALGLVSGGPGCAPPLCDDIDALAYGVYFSISAKGPSASFFSPADILAPGPVVVYSAADLGLLPTDEVDGLDYAVNPCPAASLETDPDGDGVGACDNCPGYFNPAQGDFDQDGIGDECDPCTDIDQDGLGDPYFPNPGCPPDFCPLQSGGALDSDGDGWGDICDNCPSVADYYKRDSELDGFGDVCDNCPLDYNVSQSDADGDGIGDTCDLCSNGAPLINARLKLRNLGTPGLENLNLAGTIAFPASSLPLSPMDLPGDGMRVRIVDHGSPARYPLDLLIPPGLVPTVCDPKDGWTTNTAATSQKYKNVSGGFPPACASGSALGIRNVRVTDRTAGLKGALFKVTGRHSTYGPTSGALSVTVLLGDAAAGSAGQCTDYFFPPGACVFNRKGTTLKCK